MKLNAAVHHDGDIPTPIGGPDGRAGDVTRPDGRRARYAARHFDAGLYRKIRHGHGRDLAARRELGGKGGDCHKAGVVGDTVGDPFKDTSGPAINILIKLLSMVSIVFAGLIVNYSIF